MLVLKFGGTSVGSSESISNALDITKAYADNCVLLVSSAMSTVTNSLVSLTQCLTRGDRDQAQKIVQELKNKHLKALEELLGREATSEENTLIEEVLKEITALVKGSLLLKECSSRVYDAILSCGELLSTRLIFFKAKNMGWDVVLLDSRKLIKTDDNFTEATIDWEKTTSATKSEIKPIAGRIYIAQGFIGSNGNGVTTTLGRGGSDYSASIYGSILGAKEVQIWTDVNGILTTDPRVVKAAKPIPEMTYSEAAELAFFGAKVVHPSTIQPAVKKQIPVFVKNTHNPSHPGTKISQKASGMGLRAISGKKDVTLITVTSSRMLHAHGFLAKIFDIFKLFETSVDLVATSEVSVSMTIENTTRLNEISEELNKIGEVKTEGKLAILALIGPNLWRNSEFVVKVFQSLVFTDLKLITLGSSDINLSLVIPSEDLAKGIHSIHDTFFG